MELEYIIADPTGNITALILTPVPEGEQPKIAAMLMSRERTVEQTGFLGLTERGVELRMAGGEFCGNAAMSAAAAYASALGLSAGEKVTMPVRVSGVSEPVTVELEAQSGRSFSAAVDMPRPLSLGLKHFSLGGARYFLPLVRFPGITHIIAPGDMDKQEAERAAREWCAVLNAPALGMMLFDERRRRLKPLVYVPGADTLFWERSCASGTAAVGVWMSVGRSVSRRLTISEPGGCLSIEASFAGKVLRLGGQVRLGERKNANVVEN